MMPSYLEIAAALTTALAIWLAARNNPHTWSTGIVACGLYGVVFFQAKLYADVTLQVFFVITSLVGWWQWLHGKSGAVLPISRTPGLSLVLYVAGAIVVAVGYGAILHYYTDAYAPFVDSLVLTFSVLGQFLLMSRRLECWYAWLIVNTLSVPLYFSRELYLTGGLYLICWFNAWYGMYRWRREFAAQSKPAATLLVHGAGA